MTKTEVMKLVAVLCAAYPSAKFTAETSSVYEHMLADLDGTTTTAAVEQLISSSRWLPTVAEIRERVLSLRSGEIRPGGDAWGSVRKAIARRGRHRVPGVDFEFSDPVVHEAVRALGWAELCDSENAVADRARFTELYDRLAVLRRRRQLTENLPAVKRYQLLQVASKSNPPLGTGPRKLFDLEHLKAQNGDV